MRCIIFDKVLWLEDHIGLMHSVNWITSSTLDLTKVLVHGVNIQRVNLNGTFLKSFQTPHHKGQVIRENHRLNLLLFIKHVVM